MNKVTCDKCGTDMKPIDPNSNCGMICPNCGWGWATSPYDPMTEDNTVYSISLLAGNCITDKIIKTISQITSQNYLSAKKAIDEAPTLIYSGKAKQVDPIIKELEAKAILFEVSPKYPYQISQK